MPSENGRLPSTDTVPAPAPRDLTVPGSRGIAVLGLGNVLLGDEGIGVRAVEALREGFEFPPAVELIDGGTMGLDLLPFIEGREAVLIIDAVSMGAEPGTISVIEGDDIPAFVSTKLSIHQIGFPDVLAAARLLGIAPSRMALVGIQFGSLDTGFSITPSLLESFGRLLDTVLARLLEWGVAARRKAGR